MTDLEETPVILREYITYTEVIRGRSRRTADEYFLDLRIFFRWLTARRTGLSIDDEVINNTDIMGVDTELLRTVTAVDIYDFMMYLSRRRASHQTSRDQSTGIGAAARSRKMGTLRMFFKYLLTNKWIDENPVDGIESPKLKKALPRYLSVDQCIDLLNSIDGPNKIRDYCMITLFLNSGMRVSELVGLDVGDINGDTCRVTGKGDKERTIYLNPACLSALSRWLEHRIELGFGDHKPLFISRNNRRIDVSTVKWLVKKYMSAAGIDSTQYSVHKLRHTAATLMYQNGVDVRALQEILGHEQLNTTQIYTHIDKAQLREAVNANPLATIQQKENAEEHTDET